MTKSGIWLLSDQIFAIIGGLAFWLILTNIAQVSDIGQVSAVLGVASIAGFLTLGLEFIILREASQKKSEVFGTFLIFEFILLIALSVPVFFLFEIIFPSLPANLFLMAGLLLFLLGLWEFAVFSVIGLLRGKFVAIVHISSVTIKVLFAVIFVQLGLGSQGILLAIILQIVISTVLFISLGIKEIGFQVVSLKKLWPLIKLAIGNYVSKIARIVTTSITFLILPIISSDMSLAGVFYIQYTIAITLINAVSVLAILSIPGSRVRNEDMSPTTTRLGLYLLAPMVAMLLTVPSFILGFFGSEYTQSENIFRILILATIPATIIWNFTSSLNSSSDKRKLILLGIIQLSVFWILIILFGQQDPMERVSFSIFGTFVAGASYAFISMRAKIKKAMFITISSILISTTIGFLVLYTTQQELAALIISVLACILFLIKTDFPLNEIKNLLKKIYSK